MPIPGTILTYLIGITMVFITVLVLVRKHFGKEISVMSEVKEEKKEVSPEPTPAPAPVPVAAPAEPKSAKEPAKAEPQKCDEPKAKPEKKKRGWLAATIIFLFKLVIGVAIITAAWMYVWDKVNTEVPRGTSFLPRSGTTTSARPSSYDVHMMVAKMFSEKLAGKDIASMLDIVYCESSYRQFDKDGNVLVVLNGLERNKDSAVGAMMIKEMHRKKAESLGYNIDTAEGNIGYGIDLFLREGYKPWEECVVALAVKSLNGKTTVRLIDAPLIGWSEWVTVGPSCHIETKGVVRAESDILQVNGTNELDVLPVGVKQDPFYAAKLRFATKVGEVAQKVRYICTE